ncbi:bifunctional 4-hydroxy-2-oxoglutarate aldolase/2-dehydro-3-deoxy-phosphogluconate aldolase [Aliikangiella sp. G2MR2-5]|uniref:bifunctional 4-hydroxy-2-oxoglutarate aldolase/2-dehydro-3-deoxy-phosphogluconate aldolase n=1 Tax=Aliikangiella sp. G2MR2-5 TaxID=2788943 RepID=UPI0018AA4B54|nr:bifunctional 4-hydroxy-2-oxoglutarate aldolase/2-dehydro-3-deoxy-phosphogluconate aldolase [Aliikangiella sp. G2MR2-5]
MEQESLSKYLSLSPVIPVVEIDDSRKSLPLVNALIQGGIKIIEITLRTESALESIATISQKVPSMCVGAGTVTDVTRLQNSVAAGAHFLVSPGATKSLIDGSRYHDTPLLPGAVTPSEVMSLYQQGFRFLKFFPAEAAGGQKMLRSIAAPLPEIKFCPTGGINQNNIQEYLTIKNVICAGSSWVAESDLIKNNNWSEITRRAREISSSINRNLSG